MKLKKVNKMKRYTTYACKWGWIYVIILLEWDSSFGKKNDVVRLVKFIFSFNKSKGIKRMRKWEKKHEGWEFV